MHTPAIEALYQTILDHGPEGRDRFYAALRARDIDPRVGDLRPGWVLQREIIPAACHATWHGVRTPEVRVMCLPDTDGRSMAGMVFTRVKAPDVFLSNAGHTARLGIPGTGEGYGVVVFE